MKCRCRFCSNLDINGYTGQPECLIKEKILSEPYTRRVRECDSFTLVEIDLLCEIEYKPVAERKRPSKPDQLCLFGEVKQ
ncbi:MAG: hypothetical protein JEZ05_08210 [Tenericutes bacterium]|nr:hypothetical protein [Mycoplasmatota bacterium]